MFMYGSRRQAHVDPAGVGDVMTYKGFTIAKNNGYLMVYSTKGTGKLLFTTRLMYKAHEYCDELIRWLYS